MIEFMKRSHLLNVSKVLIFIILIGTPLFYLKQGVYPYIFSKTLFFQFVVEILLVVWLPLAIADARYRPQKTPLLIASTVFLLVLIATSLFGVDFHRSFWSTYERMLGVFTILHLLAFAFIISSLYKEIPWKKILYASLATAAFVSFLAILQKKIPNLLLVEPGAGGRPGSTFGNPTFLAGYLSFNILIGLYLFFDTLRALKLGPHIIADRNKRGILYVTWGSLAVFTLLCFTALFLSETRGDIIGLGAGFFVLLCIFALRPPEGSGLYSSRRFYAGLLLFLFLFGSLFWFTRQSSFWEEIPGLNRFRDVSFSILESDTSLLPRLIALKAAWSGFVERPILGWGLENFNVPYNKYYDPRALEVSYQETRFDKPHNFVLEDLVSGGVPLLLARIALLGIFVWQAFRVKNLFGCFAIAAAFGFMVRNLFIFDTLGPMLMLYLFFGFIDGEYKNRFTGVRYPEENDNRSYSGRGDAVGTFSPYLFILIGAGLVAAYMFNIPSMKASYYEFYGFKWFHNNPTRAIGYFDKALAEPSPYRWNFVRDFAAAVSEGYFYNLGKIKKEDAIRAIHEMETVARDHPEDAYNHYSLVDMYNQTSDIDPEKFLAAADREAQIALELSPRRQEIFFSMAKTKSLRGDYKGALKILKEALDLDPKVADAHFYYGLLLFADKDLAGGYSELKKAVELGKRWKNYYEPRAVADYFLDAGHEEEAIDLYKTAISMSPGDSKEILYHPLSQAEEKLNIGQRDDAISRKILGEAIKLFSIVLRVDPNNLIARVEIGVAYYFQKDYDSARKYLHEAAADPSLSSNALYVAAKPIFDQLGIEVMPQ
ncbi:MAG: hypothetical protein A3B25_00890 [Candidatus Ryanbacteria bacterium RIFCSPLOWO2_01_FULL_48_26]|uniref:O-antigen ligase-related domain-containing protein n=1 Tax=Candidatus Ryanbacteria bacterium RIFCSPLOWO2_01_FULL_48_26 TaxID=1802126 RepID=A0A1G2GR91_9BACT|nr:MAG: hypothetical protein A3B25_00890 [Candidatus Ryanbacteria bacterium RIFCSPLOWO2_01_FULL_48_26]